MVTQDSIQELIERGEHAKAEEAARLLLKSQPQDVELKITLCRTLMRQEQYPEASLLLNNICQEDKDNFEALWLLGFACKYQKKFDEAVEAFKKALELDKLTSAVHFQLGRIYNDYEYGGQNKEAARRHLRHATSGVDAVPDAFIDRISIETPERANYVLRNGLKRFPAHARMNEILCWRLYSSGDSHGAILAIQSAYGAGVETQALFVVEGLAQLATKQYNKAIESLGRVNFADDRAANAIKLLKAVCLLESEEYDAAQEILTTLINDDFNNYLEFAAHLILMCLHIRQRNISDAERLLAEIPIGETFEQPLLVWLYRGEFDFEPYFTEALDTLIENSNLEEPLSKAKGFRATFLYNSDEKPSIDKLKQIREDLLAALELWSDDSALNSCLSSVSSRLKDWIGALRHHWLGVLHQSSAIDYYPPPERIVLESIYANRLLIEKLFSELDNILVDDLYDYTDNFAKRCLRSLIEFFHEHNAYNLVARMADKFTYQQLQFAGVLFEVAYAVADAGNKKRARDLYKGYLRDVGPACGVANNLALLEEGFGNLLEAERLLEDVLKQDPNYEKGQENLSRVRNTIQKLEDQKRASQLAADLFVQETDSIRNLLARLYSQKTKDDLIFCDHKRLANLMGLRADKADQKLSEFIGKKYLEEILDPAIAFHGKVMRANPVIVPYLEDEIRAADEASRIVEIASNLRSESLDNKYGFNRELIDSLSCVHSAELSQVLERDLREAVTALITGSYKAALVLCGSIAETILLDQLTSQREIAVKGLEDLLASADVKPKPNDRRIERWTLDRLLDVSLKIGVISTNLYHWGHGIRDFRNLVHPAAEQRKPIEVSAENARMAWSVVKRLIRELNQAMPKELGSPNGSPI